MLVSVVMGGTEQPNPDENATHSKCIRGRKLALPFKIEDNHYDQPAPSEKTEILPAALSRKLDTSTGISPTTNEPPTPPSLPPPAPQGPPPPPPPPATPPAPPKPPKTSQNHGIGDWGSVCLAEHNLRRASCETLNGKSLPPLVWDHKLYQAAQRWANELAKADNGLQHSGSGENLASTSDKNASCKWAVDSWFNEYPLYHNEKIGEGNFVSYGHFTQLVWEATRKLGCAYSDSSKMRYMVCRYDT